MAFCPPGRHNSSPGLCDADEETNADRVIERVLICIAALDDRKGFRKDDDNYEQPGNEMGVGGSVFGTCRVRVGKTGVSEGDGHRGRRDQAGGQYGGPGREPADFARHEPDPRGAERKYERRGDARADAGVNNADSAGRR
jgi:hypothetical protein